MHSRRAGYVYISLLNEANIYKIDAFETEGPNSLIYLQLFWCKIKFFSFIKRMVYQTVGKC